MSKKYRSYTDQQLIDGAREVKSMSSLLRKLGLIPAGGNFAHTKKKLQSLKVDTSHWTGQGWSKNQQTKDWSQYSLSSSIKPHLIKIRGHQCEICRLNIWLDSLIPLELDHINGDRTNNKLSNLRLLCPNCHAQTDTYCGKNIGKVAERSMRDP